MDLNLMVKNIISKENFGTINGSFLSSVAVNRSHPEISTVISDTKRYMAEFDQEHGRSAYEAFVFERLMNIVTHIIPIADRRWKAMQMRENGPEVYKFDG